MPDWDGFTIQLPHTIFEETAELQYGVQVRQVGGRNAPDSAVVVVPDSGVMLVGDYYFPPPFQLREDSDGIDFEMAKRLLAERHRWYVDSHSEPRESPESET